MYRVVISATHSASTLRIDVGVAHETAVSSAVAYSPATRRSGISSPPSRDQRVRSHDRHSLARRSSTRSTFSRSLGSTAPTRESKRDLNLSTISPGYGYGRSATVLRLAWRAYPVSTACSARSRAGGENGVTLVGSTWA